MSKGTATEIVMCGMTIRIGDSVRVEYKSGGFIEGKIIELWSQEKDNHLQARVDSWWCFHDCDSILRHSPADDTRQILETKMKGGKR